MDRFISLVITATLSLLTLPAFAATYDVLPEYVAIEPISARAIHRTKTPPSWWDSAISNGHVTDSGTVRYGYASARALTTARINTPLAKSALSTALRMNPTTGLVTLFGAYLISHGLEYINGQWSVRTQGAPNTLGYTPYGTNSGYGTCISAGGCSGYDVYTVRTTQQWNTYCSPAIVNAVNVSGTWYYYCGWQTAPTLSGTRPANDSDWDAFNNDPTQIPDSVSRDMARNKIPLPVTDITTSIDPSERRQPIGPSYDDVDGQKKQPYAQFDPKSDGRVSIKPYEQTLDANGDPIGNPQEIDKDPCEIDPQRSGCSRLGELDDEIPEPDEITVTLNPMAGWDSPGACPADVVLDVMGQSVPFKFQGACDFFTMIRPVILAGAWIVATLIFVGGVRT